MPIADAIRSVFEQSRPAKVRRLREQYMKERIKMESEEGAAPSFEDWLKEKGVDPKELIPA